jgi:phage shock protein C
MSSDKKLTRSADNRMFAGVCGGLGEYFGIDATLIRVIFVLVSLLFGALFGGMIVYAILWVVMPEESTDIPSAKVLDEDE